MTRYARANPSTSQDKTNLISGRAGSAVRVKEVYISSDTEMAVSLFDATSHTLLWRQYVGARGGSVVRSEFLTVWGEGLDYSTSAAGNVFLAVGFDWYGKAAT